jgi:chemotaxis protein methyltransferase WspC
MHRIEQRLRESMGLDAESIGSSSLQRIVRLRMQAAAVASVAEYEHLLHTSAQEWNQLVEAVVVTETWFFRDRQAFGALTSMIQTDWLPAHPTGRVNILSLPCSSGEEPYSIVMALLDAGIAPHRFAVSGVDLSERMLQKAMTGLYGRNSFRGQDVKFRDRHFLPEGDGYRVKPNLRENVIFQQANLLGDAFTLSNLRFDYIFCRNLLIYFDRVTQRQAFTRLEKLLAPGGTLFVGPAEVPLALENHFTPVNLPMAFACRRTDEHQTQRPRPTTARHDRHGSHHKPAGFKPAPAAPPVPAPPRPVPATAASLDSARELADSGHLAEAERLCHLHLERHGGSVQAFYLLGVIHDAKGSPTAREFYRKALYLDPNHYESLLQMALLAEKEGRAGVARNLRRRAQRLQLET